jgi:mannitol-specific phosphotransferase system IIBC component
VAVVAIVGAVVALAIVEAAVALEIVEVAEEVETVEEAEVETVAVVVAEPALVLELRSSLNPITDSKESTS